MKDTATGFSVPWNSRRNIWNIISDRKTNDQTEQQAAEQQAIHRARGLDWAMAVDKEVLRTFLLDYERCAAAES
jgi:hypothetical protein